MGGTDNDEKLRLMALRNAQSILHARRRTETELREQSEWLRVTLASIGDAVVSTDADGRVTFMNEVAEALTGWSLADALGHPLPDVCQIVNESSRERLENPALRALREGAIVRLGSHAILIAKDGTEHPIDDSAAPIRSAEGKTVGSVLVFRDITKAEETRARLAAIVESSDDAIISKTLDGIVTSWNAAAERLLGYRAEEMIGQSITTVIPPDRQGEEAEILGRLRRDERVDHFETVRMAKDGRLIDVSLSISPIRDGTGRVIGASKIMRDISERRQAEEALRRAQAQLADRAGELEQAVADRTAELRATNQQLEAFVYSIAHDLRAPLRAMQGFSAMLVDEADTALSQSGKDYAQRINRAAQFMDALLMDLLTFSRTVQQRIVLTPVKLEPAVRFVLNRLEKEIQETNAHVELAGPWPAVWAHERTLGQVLFNLISNALKFAVPGVPPTVRVRVQELADAASPPAQDKNKARAGKWVRVWVEDNGIGIAPEYQEQIFRLFTRLHGEKYAGTGLGLAIVQKGVERMGGQVGVESTAGKGCRFWLELRKA